MNALKSTLGLLIVSTLFTSTIGYNIANATRNTQRKIIVFDDKIGANDEKNIIIEKYHINKIKDIGIINGISAELTEEEESTLRRENAIIRIEDDAIVTSLGKTKPDNPPIVTQPAQMIPWNITRIKADQFYNKNYGQDVKVAVVDSGIDLTHPDLKDHIRGGYNAISKRGSYSDDYGHGTHVSGIIAAQNNLIGVVGTSPNVGLYSVKVLNSAGNGYLSDLIEGIEWSITNGMQIVNMSLGVSDSSSLHDAIIKANQAGIILIAAAGNSPSQPVDYPAAYPEVISVASTDYNNQISYFCPNGKIDIVAPGEDINSTYKGGSYVNMSGTSMATPHVTGAAALLLSIPLKADLNGDGKITQMEIKQRLQNTSSDLGVPGTDDIYGSGILDLYNAINK